MNKYITNRNGKVVGYNVSSDSRTTVFNSSGKYSGCYDKSSNTTYDGSGSRFGNSDSTSALIFKNSR